MGISLELYRARIGSFRCRGSKFSALSGPDSPLGDYPPSNSAPPSWKLNWRKLILALLLLLISALCYIAICQLDAAQSSFQRYDAGDSNLGIYLTTCRLTLLHTMISALCHALLLIIGCIEVDPGPMNEADVLAELAVGAPNEQVRDVLRDYKSDLTTTNLKKAFTKHSKELLVETLKYLGVPNQDQYVKDTVIHNLIVRVQNLLPEKCSLCDELYRTKLSDIELLKCVMCSQAAHNSCLAKQFQVDEQSLLDLGTDEVMKRINPCEIPGLHYLCKECEERTVPSDEVGKLKRLSKKQPGTAGLTTHTSTPAADNHAATHDQPDADNQPPTNSDPPSTDSTEQPADGQDAQTQIQGDQTEDPPAQGNRQQQPICPHYKRGTCRHGLSGNSKGGCSKAHPRACPKLIQHGTRGPLGCNKGANCEMFHPRMCSQSLQARECLTMDCKLRHVKGTIRTTSNQNASRYHGGADHSGNTRENNRFSSYPRHARQQQTSTHSYSQHTSSQNHPQQPVSQNYSQQPAVNDNNYTQQPADFLDMMQTMRQELMAAMQSHIADATAQLAEQIKQSQQRQAPQGYNGPVYQTPQWYPNQNRHNQMPPNY